MGALPPEPWVLFLSQELVLAPTKSYSVAQAGPELMMILDLSPTSAGITGVSTTSVCVKVSV